MDVHEKDRRKEEGRQVKLKLETESEFGLSVSLRPGRTSFGFKFSVIDKCSWYLVEPQ